MTLSMSLDGKILEEGDADRCRELLEDDTIQELRIILVPVILGGAKKRSLSGAPGEFLSQDLCFNLKRMEEVDGVVQLHYVRSRNKG